MAKSKVLEDLKERNRIFAMILIAVITVFLMGMAIWNNYVMASGQWCSAVIGTELATGEAGEVATTANCIALMHDQLTALSIYGYIGMGTLALCVAVLVIIVVAGGRVDISASKSGIDVDIGKRKATVEKDLAEPEIKK
jgi:hypothetical protein